MSEEIVADSTEIEAPEQDVQEEIVGEQPEISLEEKVEALAEGDVEAEAAPGQEAAPAYTPNFKYNVRDEEFEIDEMFRPLITDKESEAKVRDIFEKAQGIDHIKQERAQFKEDFTTHKEALTKQTGAINTLSGYLDNGDYESFFQALEIPKQEIMKYALMEAQRESWTPEQKQAYADQLQTKRRANVYQEQYNDQQSELSALRQDQVVKDYQLELYRPEVQQFQTAFDQRNGKDAFRNEVAELGTYHEKVHGKVLPIGELVKTVMNKFEPFMQTNGSAAQPAAQTQSVVPAEVPVIPNTGPAGQAPAQKAIKSLEDLEKLADSL